MKKLRMRSIVTFALVLLIGGIAGAATITTSSISLEGKGAEVGEVTLGNLVADTLRSAAGADLALVNASQIRPVDLPAGALTDAQLNTALAYPDETVATVQLTGAKVKACLERGLALLPQPNKGFLQVANLSISFDSSRPAGSRVTEVRVNGQPLDGGKEYKVAMPASLAKGAGGYFAILNGAKVQKLDTTLAAAVKSYLAAQGTASAKADSPRLKNTAGPATGG